MSTKTGEENNKETNKSIESVVLDYCKEIFTKEKHEEFFSSLTEEQNRFMHIFISGFQSAIGCNIVGVYDYEYIKQFKLNQDILNTIHVVLRPIEVTDVNIKFVIVYQMFN